MPQGKQTDQAKERGLRYWMERVVAEAKKARDGFDTDPVHDLRVAIRRCRSMAEGFRAVDPDPTWQKMRVAGKAVFAALGDLRDDQVLMEWIEKLSSPDDPVRARLLQHCQTREQQLKQIAAQAVDDLDIDQWLEWAQFLDDRALLLPPGGAVFQVLALERWSDARALHAIALRNRSKVALHSLRIGIKKFRYLVENFLPEQYEKWSNDLKDMQDLLGDIHDLDVLWDTAGRIHAFADPELRRQWFSTIRQERDKRLEKYRQKMVGRESLWHQWRAGLPQGEQLCDAVVKKFEAWASFLDADVAHTHHVLDLGLCLFRGLVDEQLLPDGDFNGVPKRNLLHVGIVAHEVGRNRKGKHHKAARRMVEKLDVPPGWTPEHLRIAGLVARYHTGSPPMESQKSYAELNKGARRMVDGLAGVLRLADAMDSRHDGAIQRVNVRRQDGVLLIDAEGYSERTREAERIAAARHLLEISCGLPVVIRPFEEVKLH